MRRLDMLEGRRRALLQRCEEQRLELAYRVAQIGPSARLTEWRRRGSESAANHPLAWVAGLAGLVLMLRTRRILSGVAWISGLIALASRATTLLRVFAQLRALVASVKQSRRPQP